MKVCESTNQPTYQPTNMQPMKIVHEEFNFYGELNVPVEMTLPEIEAAVLHRLQLYRLLLRSDPLIKDDLSTSTAVAYDQVSYYMIMMAAHLCSTAQRREAIVTCDILETRLMQARLPAFHPKIVVRAGMLPIVEMRGVPDKLSSILNCKQSFSCEFEHVPSYLISNRKVMIHRGIVFLDDVVLKAVAERWFLQQHHARNMRKAQIMTHQGKTHPSNLTKLFHGVVKALHSFHALLHKADISSCSSSNSFLSLQDIKQMAPKCIQHLLSLGTDVKFKQHHLQNTGRMVFIQFMLYMGWTDVQITKLMQPKIDIAYEQPSERKQMEWQLKSTFKWLNSKVDGHPMTCSYIMKNGLCPWKTVTTTMLASVDKCASVLRVSTSDTGIKDVYSPVKFTERVVRDRRTVKT